MPYASFTADRAFKLDSGKEPLMNAEFLLSILLVVSLYGMGLAALRLS